MLFRVLRKLWVAFPASNSIGAILNLASAFPWRGAVSGDEKGVGKSVAKSARTSGIRISRTQRSESFISLEI